MLPFYAILRAITFDIGPIPAKLLGVFAMFGSIGVLFVLPWLDTSKVRSMRYRPFARSIFVVFTAGGAIEVQAVGFKWLWLSQILGAYYFLYFLVLLPLLGVIEKPKPRPASIADSVRKKHGSAPAAAVAAE
jgi:quinol-cytochrome oxidoreductase complex cytochrome b subunit